MFACWLIGTLLFAACGNPTTTTAPTQLAPTTAPPEPATSVPGFTSQSSGQTTASGFECPEPQPKMTVTSKSVDLLVWTEYIPQDIIDCFELVYGVKVNRDEFSSAEEMYAKLSTGGANYDVAHISDNVAVPSIRQGLLQKLDKSKLSILAGFDPHYLNLPFDPGNLYTLPYEAGSDAIAVNTDKVKNVPQSWADLWKPEYAGRIVSIDDSRAIIGLTLLTLGKDVNTKDSQVLAEAKLQLAGLVKNIKVFDSDSPKSELIGGDADLGIVFSGEAALAQRQMPSLQYIYPTEGAILWMDTYAIPANAPHMDAAYAWLNYSMQPDLFWLMLRDFPYTNPSQAALDFAKNSQLKIKDADGNETTPAALYQTYMSSPITNAPAEALQNGHRIEDVGDALPLYDQLWVEVKGNQ
jgi:spermidine/putrescine-binding protein